MNTQTFAKTQDFKALTDDELMAVNGGLFPLIPLAIGTAKAFGAGAVSYGGYKAAEAAFG